MWTKCAIVIKYNSKFKETSIFNEDAYGSISWFLFKSVIWQDNVLSEKITHYISISRTSNPDCSMIDVSFTTNSEMFMLIQDKIWNRWYQLCKVHYVHLHFIRPETQSPSSSNGKLLDSS